MKHGDRIGPMDRKILERLFDYIAICNKRTVGVSKILE